jgi:hypothetical protein
MTRAAVVIAASLLLSSCADRPPALTGGSPASAAPATGSATPSPSATASSSAEPSRVPGTAVRVTVDGVELKSGVIGQLADDRATIVQLTFPFAMDRASVDAFLPRDATTTWTDDRTVSLSIPASSGTGGFKIGGARAKDGSAVIDLVIVALQHAPSIVVSAFTVGELLAGATAPRPGAPRISGPGRGSGVTPSPDATKVLVGFLYDPTLAEAHVTDLVTRASTAVQLPRTGAPFITVGWAGSDRIVFAGERIWVTTIGAASAREIADPGLAILQAASVSPRGTYIAAASRDKVVVIDLATGALRNLSGHHDDCQIQAGPLSRIAWSQDERRLAVVECEASAPTTVRTRIIDIATDRSVATVDGGLYGIASLLNGTFQVSRQYTEQGEGARLPWVMFDFDGSEKMRYLGRSPTVSPDGGYLLDLTCCAGEGFTLRDLVAQKDIDRGFPGSAQWLRDGRLLVVTR